MDHSVSGSAMISPESRVPTLRGSKFLRNVTTLVSGQAVAVAVPILAAPLLGRLYTPVDYGTMGIYLGFSSVLVVVGNWKYSQAIIVEKHDRKADAAVGTCVITSFCTTLVACVVAALIIVFCLKTKIMTDGVWWFALLPFSTASGGLCEAVGALANRHRHYRLIAVVRPLCAFCTVTTSITLGVLGFGCHGLLAALAVGQMLSLALYGAFAARHFRHARHRGSITLSRARAIFRRHRKFAIYTTPGAFIADFAMQWPVYLLTLMGATGTIGLFSRGRQLLTMPVSLVSGSVTQVFQQRAAVEFRQTGNCRRIFWKTFVGLFAVGCIPTVIVAITAPDLFAVVLGTHWREAGTVAQILSPMLLLRFMCNPLSSVFYVVEAQKKDFWLAIVTSAATVAATATPYWLGMSGFAVIGGFSLGCSLMYIIYMTQAAVIAERGAA